MKPDTVFSSAAGALFALGMKAIVDGLLPEVEGVVLGVTLVVAAAAAAAYSGRVEL